MAAGGEGDTKVMACIRAIAAGHLELPLYAALLLVSALPDEILQRHPVTLAEGLTTADVYSKQPEELAKLLGVDAVLMTTLEKNKNFSDGVAYGLAAGRTVLNILGQGTAGSALWLNASDINMNSYLYDAGNSKLLWKTYRKGGSSLPSNVDDLVQYYSNWIAKKLPYRS